MRQRISSPSSEVLLSLTATNAKHTTKTPICRSEYEIPSLEVFILPLLNISKRSSQLFDAFVTKAVWLLERSGAEKPQYPKLQHEFLCFFFCRKFD